VRTEVGVTGVVGLLEGNKPGKTVLLRADMDALPILEENDAPYKSTVPGKMHACGHDAHTSILLGTASLLSHHRDAIAGRVKFMFQPAEEGGAGAKKMIDDGLMDNPSVDGSVALHVAAQVATGRIALHAGPANANSDRFVIAIRGQGGHAARPHQSVDPVVIGAYIVTALQTLVSREISPFRPAVITIGKLTAGTAANIIPDTALIEGTVRTFHEDVQQHIKQRIGEIAGSIAAGMRATATTTYKLGYPVLINDERMVELAEATAIDLIGADHVDHDEATMGGEDYAFVAQLVPSVMYRLGIRHPSWPRTRGHHTPVFDVDEAALPLGVASMSAIALRYLDQA
jgi:amidohydrolase/hippurate hydrolase